MEALLRSLQSVIPQNAPFNSIAEIIESALLAADPARAVADAIGVEGNTVWIGGVSYPIPIAGKVIIIAFGKASISMTKSAVEKLSAFHPTGICVCKHNPEEIRQLGNVKIVMGSHPVPDETSVKAGHAIEEICAGLTENDLVISLVSGGGSSLVCLPVDGVSLESIKQVTNYLLKSGATIMEMNTVRKHLDRFKGGGLRKMAYPARFAGLVISDVVGNSLDVIASGPGVPDSSTYQQAIDVIHKYVENGLAPKTVMDYLQKGIDGTAPETLKESDPFHPLSNHTIICSNEISTTAAENKASELGFNSITLTNKLIGAASEAGSWLADQFPLDQVHLIPTFKVAGGETTVLVKGNGLGGRNLEVALASVIKMCRKKDSVLVTFATDGEDGPTDAAGAIVTGETLNRARSLGLDPLFYLERNDSYHFFKKAGGLIQMGPTGTNVNDLNFLFLY